MCARHSAVSRFPSPALVDILFYAALLFIVFVDVLMDSYLVSIRSIF